MRIARCGTGMGASHVDFRVGSAAGMAGNRGEERPLTAHGEKIQPQFVAKKTTFSAKTLDSLEQKENTHGMAGTQPSLATFPRTIHKLSTACADMERLTMLTFAVTSLFVILAWAVVLTLSDAALRGVNAWRALRKALEATASVGNGVSERQGVDRNRRGPGPISRAYPSLRTASGATPALCAAA